MDRYGVEYTFLDPEIKEKGKHTNLKKRGVDNSWKDPEVRAKALNAYFERTGYHHPMQNPEIFEKQQKNAMWAHQYKDTNLIYRGSYELEFLDLYYERFKNDISKGPTIKYFLKSDNNWHIYHSDFFIPSLNLVIETKSFRTIQLQTQEEVDAKKEYTLKSGFNYIMILEKDYTEFNKLIS
jgi:hypothetical protein